MQRVPKVLLLAAVACQLFIQQAAAHGVLLDPPSRNWKAYLSRQSDMVHELNAGGKYKVSNGCAFTWPKGQYGMCGDVAGQSRWMASTPPKAYKAGDTIKIQVIVQTNHMGRWQFKLCDLSATDDSKCRQLQRADGKGVFFYMPRIRGFNGGATGEAAVPTERGPISTWSWFSMPHTDCGAKYCNQFKGDTVYEVRYKLPDGFTCEHCVLQWHWLTGHNCWPPCSPEDPTFPACKAPTYQVPFCGTTGAAYPEDYWNCADVKIAA